MAARPVTIGLSAQDFAAQAMAAAQRGDRVSALATLAQGTAAHPKDAQLWHYSASLRLQSGDPAVAAEHFGKASELVPANFNWAIDHAIALSAAGSNEEALDVLAKIERQARQHAHYWSTRGNAARGAGKLALSAEYYDKALAIEPARPKALHGRAAVALERGEPGAAARFDRALAVLQSDPEAWLGKAQALDAEGRVDEARELAQLLVDRIPRWQAALKFLAQLRLAAGEADFASHYGEAAKKAPGDAAIFTEWAQQYYGLGEPGKALEVIRQARRAFPDMARLALVEAFYAGAAGEDAAAEALFASLPDDTEERWVHEGRHALRRGEMDRAEEALAKAIAHNPGSISAWAGRDFVWRLTGNERAHWLHGQEGLVRLMELKDADSVLPPAIAVLEQLHDSSPFPLGQSLRGGTQTRGRLFDRTEPALVALEQAIEATLERYREGLPPADESHPLLRHRDNPWAIKGSWSVRLSGGGDYHAPHVHPQGILSSALYLVLPPMDEADGTKAGWLELDRPPPKLGLDLEPLYTLRPREGHLALFPSTLYHGTVPFGQSRRMTVAFDVQPAINGAWATGT